MHIHPLLKLAISRPHLLGEHAQAYAAVAADELKRASMAWSVRAGLVGGAVVLSVLGLVWAGAALLIAAATPLDDGRAPWVLWLVPLIPFVAAVALVLVARARAVERPFDVLRQQMRDDMSVVREASAP